MNEKITLPTLVQLLALKTGDTKKETEDFIREFFSTITSALEKGENIKIKSLGTFKTVLVGSRKSVNVSTGDETNIPEHRKVVFVPSKEIADRINEPFSMFETIEIEDNVNLDDLDPIPVPETEPIDQPLIKTIAIFESDQGSDIQSVADSVTNPETDIQQVSESETQLQSGYEPHLEYEPHHESETQSIHVKEVTENELEDVDEEAKSRFGTGFLSGFISAIVVCGLCFVGWYYIDWQTFSMKSLSDQGAEIDQPLNQDTLDKTVETKVMPQDLPESEVPTSPSDPKVYDTISTTRYLTTMAKDHYGNYNLWPYIYMENQAFLGHPDRIKPGTQVVIPPLSKYNVDPNNPGDIAKAKKKGIEIYSRYR